MKTHVYFLIWFAISNKKKKKLGGGGNVQTLKPFELNFSDGPAKHSVSKLFINLI